MTTETTTHTRVLADRLPEIRDILDSQPPHERHERHLVVLPHAGGSASQYRFLRDLIPSSVRLSVARYPGRERRINTPFASSLYELADELAAAIMAAELHRPTILGHSMGSVLGYEVARRLMKTEEYRPALLICSGRGPAFAPVTSDLHTWSDDRLVEHVYTLGATPAGLLDSADARNAFLPPIRNDYRLVETYQPDSTPALPIDIHGFAGSADRTVSVDQVAECARLTTARFDLTVFRGGHFFLGEDSGTTQHTLAKLLVGREAPTSP
ncbi:MAG: thioesterase II family protein [Cumulibacter sp.]